MSAIEIASGLGIRFEEVRLKPYLCPAGVATIGVGATFYPSGRRVSLHDSPITYKEALHIQHWQLTNTFMPGVLLLCGKMNEERLGALTDFAFNLGLNNLKNSTLRRKILAGDWDEVPYQLRRWNKSKGKVLNGLVKRREAEAALI